MKIVITKTEVKAIARKVEELENGMFAGFVTAAAMSIQSDEAIFEKMVLKVISAKDKLVGFNISHTEDELTLELIPEFLCDLLEIYGSIGMAMYGLSMQANQQFKMLETKWGAKK